MSRRLASFNRKFLTNKAGAMPNVAVNCWMKSFLDNKARLPARLIAGHPPSVGKSNELIYPYGLYIAGEYPAPLPGSRLET